MINKELISVFEFSKQENMTEDDVIEKIRDGVYSGQIIEGEWFIKKPASNSELFSTYNNSLAFIWFSFSGKITPSQFWIQGTLLSWLFFGLIIFILGSLQIRDDSGILFMLPIIGIIWVSLATTIKRLHDRNMSGWWYLLNLLPYIGPFIVLIICSVKRDDGRKVSVNYSDLEKQTFFKNIKSTPIEYYPQSDSFLVWVSSFGVKYRKSFNTAEDAVNFIKDNLKKCFKLKNKELKQEVYAEWINSAVEAKNTYKEKS